MKRNPILISLSEGCPGRGDGARIRNQIAENLAKGSRRFILDLTSAEQIEDGFLSEFRIALASARNDGGDIRIVGLRPGLQSELEVAGVLDHVAVFESVMEAMESFEDSQ